MMKNLNIWKFTLPALLMSALVFELLPGSVRSVGAGADEMAYYYNFFDVQSAHPAALCLPLAGMVTVVAIALSLVASFSVTRPVYKATAWCALAAAALSAAPYIVQAEGIYLHPNVMATLLLSICWLLAMGMDRKKPAKREPEKTGPRL